MSDFGERATDVRDASVWAPTRLAILRWLQQRASHLAVLYEGSVPIYCQGDYPGRVHFVAHAAREIYNRLPEAVSGEVIAARLPSAADPTETLLTAWERAGLPVDRHQSVTSEGPSSTETAIVIPSDVYDAVINVLMNQKRGSETARNKASSMFVALGFEMSPEYILKAWTQLGRNGHRLAHARSRPLTTADDEELTAYFSKLETILYTLSQHVYENMDELDEILGQANRRTN